MYSITGGGGGGHAKAKDTRKKRPWEMGLRNYLKRTVSRDLDGPLAVRMDRAHQGDEF